MAVGRRLGLVAILGGLVWAQAAPASADSVRSTSARVAPNAKVHVVGQYSMPPRWVPTGHGRGYVWFYYLAMKAVHKRPTGCVAAEGAAPDDPQYLGTPHFANKPGSISATLDPYGGGVGRIGSYSEWCLGRWTARLVSQRATCREDRSVKPYITYCTKDSRHQRIVSRSSFTVRRPDLRRCRPPDQPDSETRARSGTVRIYLVSQSLYGCSASVGRTFFLAGGIETPDGSYVALHISGRVVAFGAFEGSPCARYMSCPADYQPTIFTGVFDLRTGAHHLSMGNQPVDRYALVLSPSGAVAWVVAKSGTAFAGRPASGPPYELHVYDRSGERVLDSGPNITPDSLKLNGSTLSWTNAGVTRSGQI
jgi:hypothetical protein